MSLGTPSTYADWVNILELLKKKENDDEILGVMQRGTIEWQTGVAERFSRRLIDVINYRMNTATDLFQKSMSRSRGQERLIIQALLSLRKEMSFLSKVASISALPEEHRNHYYQLVLAQADNIQQSLEESAKNDRSGKLSSIVRNHKVNTF